MHTPQYSNSAYDVLCRRYYKKQDEMITTYEQTFDQENAETTDGINSLHRQAYYLAIASFICNMVCTFSVHVLTCYWCEIVNVLLLLITSGLKYMVHYLHYSGTRLIA